MPLLVSTGVIVGIVIVAVALVVAVMAVAARRQRAGRLDQRRTTAAAHRDEAAMTSQTADHATLAAKEQAARAERLRLEAEEQAERADRERAAAEHHEAQAREIDPDVDN
jgi:hypothetical protein